MYQWIVNLIDGNSYVVVNNNSTIEEFVSELYNSDAGAEKNICVCKLKEESIIDGVKVTRVAIDSSKIASVLF